MQPGVANRTRVHFLRVNHYLCPQRPLSPSSILPPSLSHTVTSTLPSLPFYYMPSFFSSFFFPHISNSRVYYWENITPSIVCTNLHAYLHSTGRLNSCFLIKSKQPLTELLPCYLTPASHLISLCSPDAQLTPAYVILSVSQVCAFFFCFFFKVASHDKDLAPLQTQ